MYFTTGFSTLGSVNVSKAKPKMNAIVAIRCECCFTVEVALLKRDIFLVYRRKWRVEGRESAKL
jgi:hypothetical protein